MYDKKIAYLHYIKNGELVGNAGHVKVTWRGNNLNIEVYIREAYGILNGCYYIENLGGNPFKNKINIEEGQAVYKKRIEMNKNNTEGLPYGLKIEIGKEEHLEAVWSKEIRTDTWGGEVKPAGINLSEPKKTVWSGKEAVQEEIEQRENEQIESIQRESIRRENVHREIAQKKVMQKDMAQKSTGFNKQQYSDMQIAEKDSDIQERGTWKSLTFSVPVETYEDKWNELCKKYEVIHPFGNKEEYLSLSPRDFIIFPEKYQHLVNNSFLLHGYYNYRHVILGKKEEGGKNIYYLGVPGVYYEREKMVAIMFGFEGFECGEKRAIDGGFGYYMRRVEL